MIASICADVVEKTNKIEIGSTYFLSSFHDKEGAFVKVINKSTEENSCGWPSQVKVEVIEAINPHNDWARKHYAPGTMHTVNACNLYTKREDASPAVKFAKA